MKKIVVTIVFLIVHLSIMAQAPSKMSYQAVIRDASQNVLTSTNVGMRISILEDTGSGTPVFVETQTANTNANGLVSIEIGTGVIQTGAIASINWGAGTYYIKIETDPTGGNNYTLTTTSQLLSVPYAFYANNSGGDANAPGANVGDMLYWNGNTWVTVPAGQPGQTLQMSSTSVPTWTGTGIPDVTTVSVESDPVNLTAAHVQATLNNIQLTGNFINLNDIKQGVVYSTSPNPTLNDNLVLGEIANDFMIDLYDLTPQTTYYIRAFSIINSVVGLGNEIVYVSSSAPTPQLTTKPVSIVNNINLSQAKSGGIIATSSDPSNQINQRGICWSTSPNPTIFQNSQTVSTSQSSYDVTFGNLTVGTTYYIRAFASNVSGIVGYGNEIVYTPTVILPIVSTLSVSNVTGGSAQVQSNIIYEGGSPITQRGVCWSTSPNPTIADNKTTLGSGQNNFSSFCSGLIPNTTYYVRGYGTNSLGTSYGDELSFTTAATLSVGSFHQGGLVGYIFQSGDPGYVVGQTHGLIISPQDLGLAEWGCQGTLISSTATTLGTGASNTQTIVNECTTSGIAARLCSDLVLNGYSDWYLPSHQDLVKLYITSNFVILNIDIFKIYWSSSQADLTNAHYLNYNSSPLLYSHPKSSLRSVRPMRTF